MAFLKFAKAKVQKTGIKFAEWDAMRRTASVEQIATCTKCLATKRSAAFPIESATPNGLSKWCKECHAEARSRRLYQIDVNALWVKQSGCCAVCNDSMLPKGRESLSMVVDHNHQCCPSTKTCGKCVRGLIHRLCNKVVGDLEDPEFHRVAELARKYLNSAHWPKFPFVPGKPGRFERPIDHIPAINRPEYKTCQVYQIDFNAMWLHQGGKCAVCFGLMLPIGQRALSVNVDHDHKCCPRSGRTCGQCVRSMVHMSCNSVLGKIESPMQCKLRELGVIYLQNSMGV